MGRIGTCALVAAAMLVAALAGAAPARASEAVNTWDGVCVEIPGEALWPHPPLGMTPVESLLVADLDGGHCTGEVNGRPIEDEPVTVHFEYRGSQSCAYGVLDGSAWFTLDGEEFHGHASYRRVGIHVRVEITGDRGGTVVALVRGSGRDWGDSARALEAFVTECAGEGVRRAHIVVGVSVAHGFTSARPEAG